MIEETYRSPAFNLEGYRAFTTKYSDGSRRTVLEHREVMERHIGRKLLPTEIVHHKDENKLNNSVVNLALTSSSEHCRYHTKRAAPIELLCFVCGAKFLRHPKVHRHAIKLGRNKPTCSMSCRGKLNISKRYAGVVKPEQERVLS